MMYLSRRLCKDIRPSFLSLSQYDKPRYPAICRVNVRWMLTISITSHNFFSSFFSIVQKFKDTQSTWSIRYKLSGPVPLFSKTILLTGKEDVLFHVWYYPFAYDSFEYLDDVGSDRNWSVIGGISLVTFREDRVTYCVFRGNGITIYSSQKTKIKRFYDFENKGLEY